MSRPALHLLGGPTLFDSTGVPISGGPAQRHRIALLAELAIAAPNAVSRDRLIGTLWPDRDSGAGRRLLNVAVTVLRQALGAGLIVSAGDDLRLDSGAIDTDVHQFERALDEGRLEDAVASCRGMFMEGFFLDDAIEFERWVEAQRLRLARRYANALTVLAERATRSSDFVNAIGWWRALGHAEPTNPTVVLQLCNALVEIGDITAALAAAEAHMAHMRGEVGIEPDARLTARVDAIRASLVEANLRPALPRVTAVKTLPGVHPATRPKRRWNRRWLGSAAAAIALSGAFVAWRLPGVRQRGTEGEQLAVLLAPSHGSDVADGVADGFARLVALNLDQVDGVRVELLDTAVAKSSARAHHAAFTVAGSISRVQDHLVAIFTVVDSAGAMLGRATASVPEAPDALPGLVDATSLHILRVLWGRRWLVPEPRVAAISTTSLPALRAFLRAEQEFRISHWDSAAAYYQVATDLDSTFSLAYFRHAETEGWRATAPHADVEDLLAHAARYADRLGPRESLLLRYRQLFAEYDIRAIDVAETLANRYPDDPDAQFALADVWWHAGIVATISLDSLVRQWHAAIASDPVSVGPLQHAIDIARTFDAKGWYDSVVAMRAARGGDTLTARDRIEAFATWAPLAAVRDTILAHARSDIRVGKTNPLYQYGLWALINRCTSLRDDCNGIDAAAHDDVLRILAATNRLIPEDRIPMVEFTIGRGVLGAPAALPDTFKARPVSRNLAMLAVVWPAAAERAGTFARRLAAGPDQSWSARMVIAELELAARDTTEARRGLSDVAARLRDDRSTWGQWSGSYSPALARAAEGWFRIVAGDTAVGIRQMDSAIQAGGFISEAHQEGQLLSDELAVAMASYAPTRDEGITRLRWIAKISGAMPVMHLLLARALDAAGRNAEAAAEYSWFAGLWRNADPSLQHLGAEAQNRAAALTARAST